MRNDIKKNSGQVPVRRSRAKQLVTGLIAMLAASSALAAPSANDVLQGCVISSALSPSTKIYVLDMAGSSFIDGDPFHLYEYKGTSNQTFLLKYNGKSSTGYHLYNITMHHSSLCLTSTSLVSNGVRAVQKDCTNRRVALQALSDGSYVIRSTANNNYVVDVALDKPVGNASKVHMWQLTGEANQRWYFRNCKNQLGQYVSPVG